MSSALSLPPQMTADQFFDWRGDGVNALHQLIDGEPVAMSPPSWLHSIICNEFGALLRNHLVAIGSPCRVGAAPGVQPRAGASTNIRVPDLAISCSPVTGHWMREPVVLIEVLSPSNIRETREAVRAHLSIPSVREILVIDSRAVRAELLRREPDGAWPAEPTIWTDGADIVLESFGFRCELAELYRES